MKRIFKFLTSVFLAVMMTCSLITMASCDALPEDVNNALNGITSGVTDFFDDLFKEPHVCESVCEICNQCTDTECTENACTDKCEGHVAELPEHECEHVCPECGMCTDLSCTEPACADKCLGHAPAHACESKCPECGKCTDAECTESICEYKCEGHHECEHECPDCGLCLDTECTDEACADKCKGHHVCESICDQCGKCFDQGCEEPVCADKCQGHHECENVCDKCGKCTDLDCREPVCADKCAGHHECKHVCPICEKCTDNTCEEPECAEKCPTHHACEHKCIVCGKCKDAECEEPECAEKCEGHKTVLSTTETVVVEGETLDDSEVVTRSNMLDKLTPGRNCVIESTSTASGGQLIGAIIGGTKLTIELTVPEAMRVNIQMIAATDVSDTYTQDILKFTMNDTVITTPSMSLTGTDFPAWYHWRTIDLGSITLEAGDHTFVMEMVGEKSINLDCFKFSLAAPHTCESVCDECGKCLDLTCNEAECVDKCQGHHVCESKCAECDKCVDYLCVEAVCADKCLEHGEFTYDATLGYDETHVEGEHFNTDHVVSRQDMLDDGRIPAGEKVMTENATGASGGMCVAGFTSGTKFLVFVNVPETAEYKLSFIGATDESGYDVRSNMKFALDGTVIPATGSLTGHGGAPWWDWQTIDLGTHTLTAGTHYVYIEIIAGRPNADALVFASTHTHSYDNDCDVDCNGCGEVRETAHQPEADDGDCTTEVLCSVCGEVAIEAKASHTGGNATCLVKAECEVCGKEYGEFAAHVYPETYLVTNSDADKHYHVCTVCGEKDEGEAHTPNVDAATEETAKFCTVCSYVIEAQLNHVHAYEEIVKEELKATDATCSAQATYYKSCRCGDVSEETFAAGETLPHTYSSACDATCNVCTAEREDTACESVCPVEGCGKCLDKECTESACAEKCPGHIILALDQTITVEGETLDDSEVVTRPNYVDKIPADRNSVLEETGSASGGKLVGAIWGGSKFTVTFHAPDLMRTHIQMIAATDYSNFNVESAFKFYLDGNEIPAPTLSLTGTVDPIWYHWKTIELGTHKVEAGVHTLVIESVAGEMGFNLDCFKLTGSELHVCESKCAECGKCNDYACTEKECADKCLEHITSFDTTLSTTAETRVEAENLDDSNVVTRANMIDRIPEGRNSFLDATDTASGGVAVGAITIGTRYCVIFNVESAMTTKIVMRAATDTADFYVDQVMKFYLDGVEIPSPAFYLTGTVAPVWFHWKDVDLGTHELTAGAHVLTIELVQEKSMNLDAISFVPKHDCESVCELCGKCLDATCDAPACADKCAGHVIDHVCESVCPLEYCGKCTNKDCDEPVCAEKCPGHRDADATLSLTETVVVEAENLDDSEVVTRSGWTPTEGRNSVLEETDTASGGKLVGLIWVGSKFHVTVFAEQAMRVQMQVILASDHSDFILGQSVKFYLDGKEIAFAPTVLTGTDYPQWYHWRTVELGTYDLTKGDHTVTMEVFEKGMNLDAFKFTYVPPHVCESKCEECDKCNDLFCAEEACANKCFGHGEIAYDVTLAAGAEARAEAENFSTEYVTPRADMLADGRLQPGEKVKVENTDTASGGACLAGFQGGTKFLIMVNATEETTVKLQFKGATSDGGYTVAGNFKFIVDGTVLPDPAGSFSGSGGAPWYDWQTAELGQFTFSAGTHYVVIEVVSGIPNLDCLVFTPVV